MSEDADARDAARSRFDVDLSDPAMILVTMLAMYVLFTILQLLMSPDNFVGALASILQRITFLTAVYAMLVLALNLHWGYSGLFNIGVAGFMAVGVYTMAILYNAPDATPPGIGVPFYISDLFAGLGLGGIGFFLGLLLCIVLGMVMAALVGAITALPALRLRADYLAIVTVALSEIIRLSLLSRSFERFVLFSNVGFLPNIVFGTGAGRGINLPTNPVRAIFYAQPGASNPDLTGIGRAAFDFFAQFGIRSNVVVSWTYVLVLIAFVAAFYWLLVRVGNSPFGRVLKAIREDEQVAQSLGKDTRWFKIKVFMLGCALMGLGGILFEGAKGFTDPTSTTFLPLQTFYIFIALIIGGSGSNTGSVLGAALFVSLLFEGPLRVVGVIAQVFDISGDAAPPLLTEAFGSVDMLVAYAIQNISSLRFVLLGVVLIVLIQRRPEGLLGHRKEVAASVDLLERPSKPRPSGGGSGSGDAGGSGGSHEGGDDRE